MPFYQDLEKRKEEVRNFIKNNPRTTFREIKKVLHTKINKVYEGGIKEAFKDAGVVSPRTFERKTPEQKRKIIIEYVKKYPNVGMQIVRKETKINFQLLFKNTEEIFREAGLDYPRKELSNLMIRDRETVKAEILDLIKKNPLISVNEIIKKVRTQPYKMFKNIEEMYNLAGVDYLSGNKKRSLKKIDKVVDYIKKHPTATQREINKNCKTHVQLLFENGIFEAYKNAEVQFPFERLKLHGTAIKEIKDDAIMFEEQIAKKLSGYGRVNRLVKTKRGFADIIFERNDKKVVLELKNYKSHEISISQIKQLNKYLEDINCNLGFLICLQKPKKDTFLMGENKIIVLESSELDKISEFMDP